MKRVIEPSFDYHRQHILAFIKRKVLDLVSLIRFGKIAPSDCFRTEIVIAL